MEQLINHLSSKIEQLNLIANEIGLPDQSKQEKTEEFLKAIEQYANDQCLVLEKEKQDILKDTENAKRSILNYKQLMGEYTPNVSMGNSKKPLKDQLQDLQKELTEVKEVYNTKLAYVEDCVLGGFVNTNLIESTEIDVSPLTVNSLEEELKRAEYEYTNRKAIIDDSTEEICITTATLGIESAHGLDTLVKNYKKETNLDDRIELGNMLLSETNMNLIADRVGEVTQTSLREMKGLAESKKEELVRQLKYIWDTLQVPEDECENFLMSNRGLTKEEFKNYEQELAKLLVLKQERIGEFIDKVRGQIATLWDKLHYSNEQRQQFHPAYSKLVDDSLLLAHEKEVSRLQLEFEDSKYVLDRYEKYMQLKQEMEDFQATTRDPNRLFGKGQRDPGRLLREEKFRKRIDRELPKLRMELEGSLLEYEALKGRPFIIDGKTYLDVIYEEKEEAAQQKLLINAPRTPRRDTAPRKPLTSPRVTSNKYHMFNTPQLNRTRHYHITNEFLTPSKENKSMNMMHRVRDKSIRKRPQKPIRRGHFGSDDEDENEAEEVERLLHSQNNIIKTSQKKQALTVKQKQTDNGFESDDNLGVNLDIFDDGPDLSDMSDIDS
ncbi:microtubule associated protein-domain-containing protein [Sporodiniella umbellata]|nr:microtubule associated protein-domain-containing protein [Sporodiniella umbellata]